jgi:hypothetical protein
MTQPNEAVGGDDQHVVETELTPEERLNAAFDDPDNHKEEEEPAEEPGEQPVEEAEIDEEDIEPGLPAIDPPNSLTAEEKEQFKSLPREAQEFTARRIGDLEKGFNAKAREAAQAKQAAETEALRVVEQVKAQAAEHLQRYAQQFEMNVQEPDIALAMSDSPADRALYIQQDRAYKHMLAQRDNAQRDAQKAQAEQDQIRQQREALEAQRFQEQLEAEMPEIFEPESGQKLVKELNATAELLGFDPNQISDVAAIKALKLTSEWKSDSDKYRALMKKQMQRVRSGKVPPPISRPGVAQGANVQRRQAYQADREAMKQGDKDATARVLDSFFTQPK